MAKLESEIMLTYVLIILVSTYYSTLVPEFLFLNFANYSYLTFVSERKIHSSVAELSDMR